MTADDGVIESRPQFERLLAGRALAGRAVRAVNMVGGTWMGVRLAEVSFERCGLAELETDACELSSARFSQVDLRGADLGDSWARRSQWRLCDLTESRWVGAALADCEFEECRFSRAEFSGAELRRCRLTRCELQSVCFAGARLLGVQFAWGASGIESLTRADFRGAFLSGCSLAGANLYGADFTSATLVGCDLRGANLCGAAFRGARLVACQLEGTEIDAATTH